MQHLLGLRLRRGRGSTNGKGRDGSDGREEGEEMETSRRWGEETIKGGDWAIRRQGVILFRGSIGWFIVVFG